MTEAPKPDPQAGGARECPQCARRTDAMVCPHDGLRTMAVEQLAEPADPWVDRILGGKVQLEEAIGRGGMGAVYRARHLETGGLVAVKVLHPTAAQRAQTLRRFHLEAQNAASLRSVHTIRVMDFGIEDGSPYLVMEHLEGLPLSAVLRRDGRLPWRRAVHITVQIAKSLWEAHSHERRIVHRDIKPGNVFLLDQLGSQDFVKVLDFGISRSLEGTGADTRGPIGTPHSMAPEQWTASTVDGRADLYAMGCLLHEMIEGAPPFDVLPGMSPSAQMAHLARAHTHGQPPRLSAGVSDALPDGLQDFILRLLAKRPEDRPSSAEEVVAYLEAMLEGRALPTADRAFKATTARRRPSDVDHVAQQPATPPGQVWVRSSSGHDPVPLVSSELETDETRDADDPEFLAALEAEAAALDALSARTTKDSGAIGLDAEAAVGRATSVLRPAIFAALGILLGASVAAWWWTRPPAEADLRAALADGGVAVEERQAAIGHLLASSEDVPRLRGLQLSSLRLIEAKLGEADLQGADLGEADLSRADLARADLRRASLAGANLRGANLRGADLRGADLEGAVLAETALQGSKYDGDTRWPNGFAAKNSGALGPGAQLGGVDLQGADLRGASLTDANLQGGDLRRANLAEGRMRGANLNGATLRGASLRKADLRDTDLRGADLREADLRGVNLAGARHDATTKWPEGFRPPADAPPERVAEAAPPAAAPAEAPTAEPPAVEPPAAAPPTTAPPAAAPPAATPPPARAAAPSRAKVTAEPTPKLAVPEPAAAPAPAVVSAEPVPPAAPVVPPPPAVPSLKQPPAPHPQHDFAEADLRGVDLSGLSLAGRNLRLARYDARTRWPAGFDYRRSGALGPGAKLAGQVFRGMALTSLDLRDADLQGADLSGARLTATRLERADLRRANLRGTDLRTTRLGKARFEGARFDSQTRWPDDFEPADHGAELVF